MVKKVFICVLSLLTILIISACGGKEKSSAKQDAKSTVKLSFNLGEDSSQGEAAKIFKKRIEETTNGSIIVELYPNQQLGDMKSQIEQVQAGAIEMTFQGTSTLSNFAKPLELLELPFLFPNEDVMWKVLSGEVGQEIFSELENSNMVGLTYLTQGFRQITNNKGPIHSPEDVKGLKIRTMPSELLLNTWKNWKANPTAIDLGELYNALQQGVVDAEDNSLETISDLSLNEVQDYLTISNHNFLPFALVANKDWFDGLDENIQQEVLKAAKEAGEYGLEYIRNAEKEIIVELEKEMTVNVLTESEIEDFKRQSEPLYEKYSSDSKGKYYIEKLQQAVKDLE